MLASLRRLLEVQDVDSKLAQIEAELAGVPDARETAERDLQVAGQALEEAGTLLESEERNERRLEGEMREQEALMARLDEQTAQVTSQHAYEALRHEMEHARETGSNLETQALELMEAIDQAREQLAQTRQIRSELEGAVPQRLEDLATREKALRVEREGLLESRAKLCEGVKSDLLRDYGRIAGKRHPAIVTLEASTCPECHIVVPTQQAIEIRAGRAVQHCANCMRLLVSPLVLDDSQPD